MTSIVDSVRRVGSAGVVLPGDVVAESPLLLSNREMSWLDFDERVLEEALDERNPLLERVRFLGITANNLDEFFAKRVGWLRYVARTDPQARTVDDRGVLEQLESVRGRCHALLDAMSVAWANVLRPALANAGIAIVGCEDLEAEERSRLSDLFQRSIYPVLTPLVVDPAHPFPFISGGSLSWALTVRNPRTGEERFARVKVPANRDRLIEAGTGRFTLLEDLIAANLENLFPGMEITSRHLFRVLRSAEIGDPDEETDDLLEMIESELRRRRMAGAVTIQVAGTLPAAQLELLLTELGLDRADVYITTDGLLGMDDLMEIGNTGSVLETFPAFTPSVPGPLTGRADPASFFEAIRERDVLVHHPYESFDATVARFVVAAAQDPRVLAIKQTMYRTSPDSPMLAALVDAAGRGKQVAVVVELRARFDEANNIEWARRLESAGVHVAYGKPSLKIHSKIALVVRQEGDGVTIYGHVGTGNYNSSTARLYTDFGLLTADRGICADLLEVFNYLTGFAAELRPHHVLVAPWNLRSELERRVRREIEHARAGRRARVLFKMNALEDRDFTFLLYEASQAGVAVDLVIRGICRLRPGLPGLSENVRVVSVVGRLLEHSRLYYFENDGAPEVFIGSADLMKRNLDDRIEVLAPVVRHDLRRHLVEVAERMLSDRRQGWVLRDSTWEREAANADAGTQAELITSAPFS